MQKFNFSNLNIMLLLKISLFFILLFICLYVYIIESNLQNLDMSIKEQFDLGQHIVNFLDIKNDKVNFIGSFFSDYFSNLDISGQIALSVLILNQALLSALSTIVLIYYGDLLIKRFNLTIRFPKIANFIALRQRFQSFYFLISILIIALISLGEIFICIKILTM